jgi:HK97 family phage major capsid protein
MSAEQNELHELQNITHQYRKSLAAYEARTGLAPQLVDSRGSGEERQAFARMDADLTAIELRAQLKAAEARLAKLEGEPVLESRAPRGKGIPDRASAEYAQRWLTAAASGNHAEFRTLIGGADGTSATTNVALPSYLENRIIEKLQQSSVLRSIAKISTIDSKRTIAVENALPTTALVAENGAVTPADPSFSTQITVIPFKYVTATTMTMEFMEDVVGTNGIGTGMDYVAQKIAASLALKLDEAYTIGAGGTAEPQGICDAGATSLAGLVTQGVQLAEDAAPTAITADNLIDCYFAVQPQYRASPRFQWLVSDTVVKTIRKLKTLGSTGDYIWTTSPNVNGQAATGVAGAILGVPYNVGKYVPTTVGGATGTNVRGNAYAVCGHWDYFEIFDRSGMQSMIDPYSGAANMRSTLYTWMRTDSKIMLPEAFAAIYSLNAT